MSDYPRLRNVDAFPFELDGQKVICLRDQMNFSPKMMFLPPRLFYLATLLNGNNSLLDIQVEYMRQFGELLYQEKIRELIDELDTYFFLESPNFIRVKQEIEEAYLREPARPAAHAGISYENDPDKLKIQIRSFFLPSEGPGEPDLSFRKEKKIKAIIAPHIDLRRGGPCFAWSYKSLVESAPYDLFIIFGTCHAEMKSLFSVSRKDFETPLGLLQTDREFLELFRKNCSLDIFGEEIVHRNEHSIEFQSIFLKYLFPMANIKILPVLVGSFHEMIGQRIEPIQENQLKVFTETIKTLIKASGKRVCFIASADLAHIGLRFGDVSAPDQGDLKVLASQDKAMLEKVQRLDKSAFFWNLALDGDKRRICGFPPIYSLLCCIEAEGGELLRYDQSYDQQSGSVVSFASMVIY